MAQPHLGKLPPFNTIGKSEVAFVRTAMDMPLSGYIGGNPKGGRWVEHLSEEWKRTFEVAYAIPCNSATSGLMAACMAVGVRPGDAVWTTPYSMSATAACAQVLGANLFFVDIESDRFGIDAKFSRLSLVGKLKPKAIIVTNLFGHPAKLAEIRRWCDEYDVFLIEDNAQAPMATENGKYTGTIGHIGVFSLNVHKHIQCGEGGVIVTNVEYLGQRLQGCINHGELSPVWPWLGLNLRMTEPIAAIACAQLAKAETVIEGRRQIGLELCDMVKDIPWLKAHTDQPGCKHVYYLWTALAESELMARLFVSALNGYGVPIRHQYAPLLHRLFGQSEGCPVVEDIDKRIAIFEVCAYDLTQEHLNKMREIIKRVAGEIKDENRAA